MNDRFDVAVMGSGFAGSILASLLARGGRSVALIDSQRHPRFAIGESSTPIADLILRRLGERYADADLIALSTYGRWKKTHPDLGCGCKRGFSYFRHEPGQPFDEGPEHENSLLVAASSHREVADTHWYRPDVDRFLFEKAIAAGAADLSGHLVSAVLPDNRSSIVIRPVDHRGVDRTVQADWVIDATGAAGVLARSCDRPSLVSRLRTKSFASFAHYRGVESWTEALTRSGHAVGDDPFDPDAAAQHHLIDDGWIWMLRFDHGITSVGLTSTKCDRRLDWRAYPSLATMFRQATLVAPEAGLVSTGRLQRWFDPVVNQRCLMLPTAAVTIDPLHSTGIAHALAGVERVAKLILTGTSRGSRENVADYQRAVLDEAKWLDRLVSTAYETLPDFPRFTAACMLYFAAAIRCEERYGRGETPQRLWNADDNRFCAVVHESADRLAGTAATSDVVAEIRAQLTAWNTAGLLDPAVKNRYCYTATKIANANS